MIIIHILLEYIIFITFFCNDDPTDKAYLNSKRIYMKYEYFGKMSYLINLILNGIFTLNRLKTITQIR